ncbi:MAG: hydroxyacid dehydrogenase [Dehalococcoidia bacterium]|nr:hydroxyacid dehydrogenase [Dehalococcoidia bacterium]
MASKKVIVPETIHPAGPEILKQAAEVISLPEQPGKPLREFTDEAHAIIVRLGEIDREMLEQAKNLMIIAKHGVGYDNIDIEAATQKKVVVINTPLDNAESVAEHDLGLMLAINKKIVESDRGIRIGKPKPRKDLVGVELKDKTLGLIGVGHIGATLAGQCRAAFNMSVIAYDPYVSKEKAAQMGVTKIEKLDDMLPGADYVVICVPLTKETANLIGTRELNLMKPDAFLINSSRGGIVDEKALYDSLVEGTIAGAAMDVFLEEPPATDHPLFSLDNFIGTPHIAGGTTEAMRRMATTCAEEILRVFRGERPKFPINPEVLD